MCPDVAVLLASYNGEKYICHQIDSIARQVGVNVCLYISDDGSRDETLQRVADASALLPDRVVMLDIHRRPELSTRSSANNFYHIIASINLPEDVRWVAFSDQDDIWEPSHLSRAIGSICEFGLAGYSSSVLAFWPDGRRRLVVKSGCITKYNHLFEAPGPGCSFVLPRASFDKVQAHIRLNLRAASRVQFHDWAIYAVVRSAGGIWMIDPCPSLLYRQHDSNVLGVQLNRRAVVKRFQMLLGGWYREQCLAVSDLVGQSESGPGMFLRRFSFLDRFRLALLVAVHRRRLRDRLILSLAFLTMSSTRDTAKH